MRPGSVAGGGSRRLACPAYHGPAVGVCLGLLAAMLAVMAASCGNGGTGIRGIVTET